MTAPRAGTAAVLGAGALAAGVAFLVLDPAQTVTPQAAWRGLAGLGAAVGWLLAAVGAGGGLLTRIEPTLLDGPRGALHALVVGLLVWGLGAFGLAAAGLLQPAGLMVLAVALSSGWLLRPRLQLPRVEPAVGLALLVVAVPGLIDALAPPIDTDELYYHLALPRKMLDAKGLVGGFLHPSGSRPMALHLPFACLLATGGEAAPKIAHLGLTLALLVGVVEVARAHLHPRAGVWAVALMATSWNVGHDAGLAANNLPAALAVLATLDAGLRGRLRGMALAGGAALAIKYTAAAALAGCWLVARGPLSRRLGAGLFALALVAPWWAYNAAQGLHPLFPFAGWPGDLPFQYLDRYGAGRAPIDLVLLPWNAVMTGELHSNRFLGRLNPLWLVAGVAALVALGRPGARRVTAAAAIAWLGWMMGPHWLRYLLPGLPLLALAGGDGLARATPSRPGLARTGWLMGLIACLVAGLPANLGPLYTGAADRMPAAFGQQDRDDFYRERYAPWPAVAWANAHLPEDARVALLFDWSSYLVERPVVLGSVEDHTPVRHYLSAHGDRSLDELQAAGVTHVLVRRTRFLRKLYPFLSEEALQRDFDAPVDALDAILLSQATLVFEQDGSRVYRLDPRRSEKGSGEP